MCFPQTNPDAGDSSVNQKILVERKQGVDGQNGSYLLSLFNFVACCRYVLRLTSVKKCETHKKVTGKHPAY